MGKQRIEQALNQVLGKGEKVFIPYIMAGDGGLEQLEKQLLFFQENGATLVELGVPFSDPVADGPTIQAAGLRALTTGITLKKLLTFLKTNRPKIQIPIVLMTYINPLLQYGINRLVEDAGAAGVDGFIIPDVPIEEEGVIAPQLNSANLAWIQLVTVTTPLKRIEKIAKKSDGFVYAVTVAGITGARSTLQATLHSYLQSIKTVSPVPVLAGFGISTPEQVRSTTRYCDGVIVGSKIIELWHANKKKDLIELIKASKDTISI